MRAMAAHPYCATYLFLQQAEKAQFEEEARKSVEARPVVP